MGCCSMYHLSTCVPTYVSQLLSIFSLINPPLLTMLGIKSKKRGERTNNKQRDNKRSQYRSLHNQGIPFSRLNQSKTSMHILAIRVIKPIEHDMITNHKLWRDLYSCTSSVALDSYSSANYIFSEAS